MKVEWKTCLRLGVTVAVLFLLTQYWGIIAGGIGLAFHAASPLLIGFIIAYAVNILMSFFERYYFPGAKNFFVIRSRGAVCVLLSYVSLIGIVALIIGLIVPELTNCVKIMIEKIPPYLERVFGRLSDNYEVQHALKEFGNVTRN